MNRFLQDWVILTYMLSTSPQETRPLRVLFLSSDTGGGHRASAEALAKQVGVHAHSST
jgi:hypothetical protein